MTVRKQLNAIGFLIVILAMTPNAFGVSKEMLQVMRQLDALQQQVQNLQKTVEVQGAVLQKLVEQSTDNVNSMKLTVMELRKATEQSLAAQVARSDSVTTQIQALSEGLEETKARLAKLSEQLAQTQNIIQTLNAPPPATTLGGEGKPANLPDPDTLYRSGLSYFNGGQYQLAVQSFQEYLQYYGDTDLASNAQFYIGDSYYSQGDYQKAIEEYDKCMERYPQGNKLPAAQLKKGYALLALNQKQAGIRELRSLVQRHPTSNEAKLARQRLQKLGISVSTRQGGE